MSLQPIIVYHRQLQRCEIMFPRANRWFLGRAVRFAAAQGIRQFPDLGTGLPSQGHVHEVVGEIDPGIAGINALPHR